MAIIQLQPMQISAVWPDIKQCAEESNQISSAIKEKYFQNLLENLLIGKFQSWIVFKEEDGKRQTLGIAITSIVLDEMYGTKDVVINALKNHRFMTQDVVAECFVTLKEFAKNNDCQRIIFDTNVSRIKQMAEMVGLKNYSSRYYYSV